MASNLALTAVKDRGGLNGFGNIFRMANHEWWGTRAWLVQFVIWLLLVNGAMTAAVLSTPKPGSARAEAQAQAQAQAGKAAGSDADLAATALTLFFMLGSMGPAFGVIILAQDALIQERQAGTVAWVLSKPVSRLSFILSKFAADAIGVLVTMVLLQGLAAYLVCRLAVGVSLPVFGFLAALGLLFLHLLFYLALSYMLGSLSRSRGPVIAIPILFIFAYNMHGVLGWVGRILHWNLTMDLGPTHPSLAIALANGLPLPTVAPIIGTVALILIFILIALWRFNREEF